MMRVFLLMLATSFLAACNSASTNPRESGLLGGINGLSNGHYRSRLVQRQRALQQLKQHQHAYQGRLGRNQQRYQQHQSGITSLQHQVNAVERENALLARQIRMKQQRQHELQQRQRQVEAQLAALERQNKRQRSVTYAQYQQRQDLLQQRNQLRRQLQSLIGTANP